MCDNLKAHYNKLYNLYYRKRVEDIIEELDKTWILIVKKAGYNFGVLRGAWVIYLRVSQKSKLENINEINSIDNINDIQLNNNQTEYNNILNIQNIKDLEYMNQFNYKKNIKDDLEYQSEIIEFNSDKNILQNYNFNSEYNYNIDENPYNDLYKLTFNFFSKNEIELLSKLDVYNIVSKMMSGINLKLILKGILKNSKLNIMFPYDFN